MGATVCLYDPDPGSRAELAQVLIQGGHTVVASGACQVMVISQGAPLPATQGTEAPLVYLGDTYPAEAERYHAFLLRPVPPEVLLATVRALASDVSEQHAAAEALRKRETVLNQAGEMAHLGAWDLELHQLEDLNANPLTWSEEVYRIFGYAPGEVTPSNELFFSHVPPEDRPRIVDAVAQAIATGRVYSLEHRVLRRDGTERLVREHAEVTRDAQGRPECIIGAVQDITEEVQARERALAAERERAELAEHLNDEINHRVKNNLAMVSGLLQMQALRQPSPVLAAALRDSVSRVRIFARLHEQLHASPSDRIDLAQAVRSVAESAQEVFALRNGVALSLHCDTRPCPSQTVTNICVIANELITNALKHGGPDPDGTRRVEVSAAQEGNRLHLRVWNSGSPVSADFDPRAQSGLGLLLASDLIREYGGTFTLRPARSGTLAEATLPLGAGCVEEGA